MSSQHGLIHMAQEIKQGSLQVLDLRLSLGLLVPFCMTWLKPCHFLVPVFSHPVIFYFCCLFILKTSCFRDRYTFCTVFNKLGPKSLNSSEVPVFSRNADNVYLYTSDYRGEDHTIIFFFKCFTCHCIFIPFSSLSFQNSSPVLPSADEVTSQIQQSLLSCSFEIVFYRGKTGFGSWK